MKIRQGLVSNSSSSSFVLKKGEIGTVDYSFFEEDGKETDDVFREIKLETVYDVARVMIHKRGWKDDLELEKKIDKYENSNIDSEIGIYFITCNYNTWIKKEGDFFLVDTCNNHAWYDVMNQYGENILPNEIKEKYSDDYYFNYDLMTNSNDFLSLHSGIIGTPLSRESGYCCYEYMWQTGDGIVCPICGKKK